MTTLKLVAYFLILLVLVSITTAGIQYLLVQNSAEETFSWTTIGRNSVIVALIIFVAFRRRVMERHSAKQKAPLRKNMQTGR